MRKLLLILFLSWKLLANGQTNNFWNVMANNAVTFQNKVPKIVTQKLNQWRSSSICNNRGELLLYSDLKNIYDGEHKLIENGNIIPYCISASMIWRLNDSAFYLLQTNYAESDLSVNTPCRGNGGLLYTKINLKQGKFSVDASQKQVLLRSGKIFLNEAIAISRGEKSTYWASNINDSIFIFDITNNFLLKSSLPAKSFYSLNPCINPPDCKLSQDVMLFFNHSGNQLYAFFYEGQNAVKSMGKKINLHIANSYKIVRFDFDRKMGIISNPFLIFNKLNSFSKFPNITLKDTFRYEILNENPCISLDDNYLYIQSFKYRQILYSDGGSLQQVDTINLHQINLQNREINLVSQRITGINGNDRILKQSPDGRIFAYWYSGSGQYFESDVIEYPKMKGKACSYIEGLYKLPAIKSGLFISNNFSYHLHDFLRLDYKINYDCKASIKFTNNSFSEAQVSDYTWYINKLNGKTDTLKEATPSIVIEKSGKYPYKVFGHSSSKQYGEWFYDTLFVNIPEKPISNFKATDTVICRYLPLQFKNMSSAKVTKPGSLPTYVWTFGDGSPSSNDFEPTHTYTKPGVYTVSLFYSNGYCDSTLVKNQYIRVVDAPKPGFSVANRQGCSPFIANFTDTVTLNVTKKEYLFSDSSIWKTISTPKFNYTFQKPGHYWAVQKLYGYTGCIIKTDSVQFFISKGLVSSDSISITLASYDTLNHLHLEWESHPAATSYNIYRSADGINFSLLTNTTQTNFTDIAASSKPLFYKIQAMDSCGKLSSAQNTAKPQWISGECLPENEAAIITYMPDMGFGIPQSLELEWTYQHAINLKLGETNPVNPFRDENFATPGFLKKCYRYTVLRNGVKMFSNYECVNFKPQTFIPNSFTPNGDGLNDKFLPSIMGIVSYDMKIFNRWGQLIYSGSSPWDGKAEGIAAEGEVFMYSIHLVRNDRVGEFYKGMVHLIR